VKGRTTARTASPREPFTGPAHMAASFMITGYALRTWRYGAGLNLTQAAARLGMSLSHLSRIERGLRLGPTPEHAAGLLGISVEELTTPCGRCGWTPRSGTCPECGTSQSAEQVAAEIVSWLVRGGS